MKLTKNTPPHTHNPLNPPTYQVVNLFTYLTDKDLFAEIYRNQLAKRLLNQRCASATIHVVCFRSS